jgi:sterol desaturase/sphingolipid hydroxylase (fatty acid hydroxylase superfamily)
MTTTTDYREHYRQVHVPRGYSGALHLAFILVFSLGGMVVAAGQLQEVSILEWLTVPLTFLYANLAEYAGHRWVMHRRVKGLSLIYHRHTRQHHRFFTDSSMAMDGALDFRAVLFPPILMLFFFAAFALPVGLLLTWLFSANVAWLFVFVALAYYLNYELLHLAYHLPEDSRWSRLPGLRALRRLHHDHHRPAVMAHKNFNITYPIFDRLFGTRA